MQLYQTILLFAAIFAVAVADLPSDDEIDMLLELTNDIRARIALGQTSLPTAAMMREILWDDQIAKTASQSALRLSYTYSDPTSRKTSFYDTSNENIFLRQSNSPISRTHFRGAVEAWYAGIAKCKTNECEQNDNNRDFIHMITADTYLMGCGSAEWYANKVVNHIVVCQFAPVALSQGGPIYEKGKTNSQCKEKSINYEGLCYRP